MSVLCDIEIAKLCKNTPPLIAEYIDWEWQLQPGGFDLSIDKIFRLDGIGTINRVREQNQMPKKHELPFDKNGTYYLKQGYYVVQLKEIVCLPNDILGLARPRSTLIRYGATLITGVWDPGFHGKSQCGLLVANNSGINLSKQSTILQMIFLELSGSSAGFQYNHLYMNENGTYREL